MTLYTIFRKEGDLWREVGESEANTPEGAMKKLVKDEVLAKFHNGDQGTPQDTYAATPQKQWTTATPDAQVTTDVKITINSDREVQPRPRRQSEEPAAA